MKKFAYGKQTEQASAGRQKILRKNMSYATGKKGGFSGWGKKLGQFDINFIKLLRRPFLGTSASQPKANPERVVCVADVVCLRKWTAKQVSEKIYFFRETTARSA